MQGDVFDASQSLFAPVDQNNVVKLRAGSLDPRGFRSDGTTLRYVTVIRYQKGFGGPPSASPWVEWVRQRGGWWSNPLKHLQGPSGSCNVVLTSLHCGTMATRWTAHLQSACERARLGPEY
ncbi:hypothetical protein EGT47_12240 [Burkholderia cenocepacia]|nr:hypothetical protein EGT47_12240 [Burkholderia cenocepacia]